SVATPAWCGTDASTTAVDAAARLGVGTRAFGTTEVKAVGIDVSQGTVPDPYPGSYWNFIKPGSRPTDWDQDPASNRLTLFREGGKTIVRVYASALQTRVGNYVPDVQMELFGLENGKPLLPFPLLSDSGQMSVPFGPPYTTHGMRIDTQLSGVYGREIH